MAAKPPPAPGTEYVCTRGTLAYVLGLTQLNHIGKLVARGMPKLKKHGAYDLVECARWYIDDLHRRGGMSAEEVDEVVKARTRLYEAQTRHKELDTSKMAGDLVDVEDAKEGVQELAAELVSGLEQLPGRAAGELVAIGNEADVREVLRRHANEVRTRICDRLEAVARGIENSGRPATAPT